MMHGKAIVLAVGAVVVVAACSGDGSSADTTTAPPSTVAAPATTATPAAADVEPVAAAVGGEAACPAAGEEFEVAKLYIEHNATDEDTGVHGLFGGMAWSEMCIWDPAGRLILLTDPANQLDDLTVADLFFESREPPNSEVAIADIRAAFPAGEYRVAGTDFEGTSRVGAARFTHNIPAEPVITTPALADEPETAGEATVPAGGLVVAWEPVTETIDGDPVEVTAYEVIVTKEEHEDPHGLSRPVYDVHVGPGFTSLAVPAGFLEPATVYELEVLVLEESGNQTIGLGFFRTPAGSTAEPGEYADLRVYYEYNATADDLGFHVEFDGDPWVGAALAGPDRVPLFDLSGSAGLSDQGLATGFFESAEYPDDVVSRDEFLARFPGGRYTLSGMSVDGVPLALTATLIDLIPEPPVVVAPALGAVVPAGDVTISWEPVEEPAGVDPEVYIVQLFPVDPPAGTDPIALNVDLTFEVPADVTEVRIPAELLQPGEEYQFELMVVDAGGNQTFVTGSFATAG